MKIRKIIPAIIIFVIIVGIFSTNVHAEENTNYFEKSIVGSTGWSTCDQTAKEQPNNKSKTEQGKHVAIFPPQGGIWITEWYLHIDNKKIPVGNDYNVTSIEEIKQNIELVIKGDKL